MQCEDARSNPMPFLDVDNAVGSSLGQKCLVCILQSGVQLVHHPVQHWLVSPLTVFVHVTLALEAGKE